MVATDPVPDVVRERVGTVSRSFVRPDESRVKRWFLFDGGRGWVATVLLLAVFVALLALGRLWPIEFRELLDETTMVQSVFDTLLGGVILLVSIVVSVVAVGISQELTTLGEQTDRVDTALEYRDELELGGDLDVSPAQSGQFLAAVLQTIQERAEGLRTVADEHGDPSFEDDVDHLRADIDTNAAELLDTLARVEAGTTDELLVGLDYDCSWQLFQTRRLLVDYESLLSEADREVLLRLEEALRHFLVGREYFKSLYYKRELSDLSTSLLLVSLPVIVFITYILLALDAGIFPEVNLAGYSPLTVFISVGYTIALAPYVVLTAYVFRAASVTKRTLAAGSFVVESEYHPVLDR